MRVYKVLKELVQRCIKRIKVRGKVKYFCIGRNKTGTTSLKKAFEDLGFVVGDQREAELLADKYYFEGNFSPIVEYCRTAQVFQDVPFSWPETFKYLDKAYPGSKFILTVRDNSEQWYRSITQFHSKQYDHIPPTVDDLKNHPYVRKGWLYNTVRIHGTPDDDPYNKEIMVAHYEKYNNDVLDYFEGRENDLLVINLAENDAYLKFCDFLGVETHGKIEFPWENRTTI